MTSCCNIVELRQYLLHPGQRDTLIELFDREFVETQEAVGMTLLGQFRDVDRPDVFTWLRGFPDMDARAKSLGAFYDGPVWAKFRNDANATMVSSDDVRLLRPARVDSAWQLRDRPQSGVRHGLVLGTIYPLSPSGAAGFTDFFDETVAPRFAAAGARPFAIYETEPSPNTWPRLPVREGEAERCFVWFARFTDRAASERSVAMIGEDTVWREEVRPELRKRLTSEPEVLRLVPTERSRMLP